MAVYHPSIINAKKFGGKTMWGVLEKISSEFYERFKANRGVASEVEGLKQGLLMTTVANNLDAPLQAIHVFFTKHPKLLELPDNRLFVTRWLRDPYRQAWGSVPGMWTKERWDQLRTDVGSLRTK
jgi:hypothetical protein